MSDMTKALLACAVLCLLHDSQSQKDNQVSLLPGLLSVRPDLAQLCNNVSQPGKLKSLKFKRVGLNTILVDADAHLSRTVNPITKGDYSLRNGTLDMSSLQRVPFPLEKYYWRGRLQAFDPDMALCVEVGAHFVRSFL